MNKRDKVQIDNWKIIINIITTMEQQEIDALEIDRDKEAAAKINADKYKWLLDNWQLGRPKLKTQLRRTPLNFSNFNNNQVGN